MRQGCLIENAQREWAEWKGRGGKEGLSRAATWSPGRSGNITTRYYPLPFLRQWKLILGDIVGIIRIIST